MPKPPAEFLKTLDCEIGTAPIKSFNRTSSANLVYLAGVVLCVGFGFGMLALGFGVESLNAREKLMFPVFGVAMALLFWGLAAFWWIPFYRKTARHVSLYEEGVIWEAAASGWHAAKWICLKEIIREETTTVGPNGSNVKVKFTTHQELYFGPQMGAYDILAAAVQEIGCDAMLPAARKQLEAGDSLTFGPVKLSQTEIIFDRTASKSGRIPLTELRSVEIFLGSVWINGRFDAAAAQAALSTIPNYMLLFALLPVKPTGVTRQSYGE